jgi:hypothetical protein
VAAGPTRRTVLTTSALAALAAAGTAGCSPVLPWAAPPRPAPDVGVLKDVIAAENQVIGIYTAVIAAFPGLRPVITPLRRQHEEHLAALRGRLVVPPGAPASASALPSPAHRGGHPAEPRSWASATQAVAALATAERAQASALVARLASVPPSLAQLLASIGASEASHVAVLHAAGSR